MQNDPVQPKRIDFGIKNIALILAVAAFLGWAAFIQKPSGVKSSSAFSLAAYSSIYDSTKPEFAFGSHKPPLRSELADAIDFDSRAIRPGIDGDMLASAAVLGASAINPELLGIFSDIRVRTTTENSTSAVQNYAQQLKVIQDNNRANEFFSMPFSKELAQRELKFINDLKILAVPSSMADYHTLLIGYYAFSFMETSGSTDIDREILESLPDVRIQLDLIRKSTKTASGVELPEIYQRFN